MRESIGKTNGRYNTKNNTYGYNEKRRHIVRPNSIKAKQSTTSIGATAPHERG